MFPGLGFLFFSKTRVNISIYLMQENNFPFNKNIQIIFEAYNILSVVSRIVHRNHSVF